MIANFSGTIFSSCTWSGSTFKTLRPEKTYPVLRRAPHKSILTPTSRRIPFDRMSPRPNQIKQLRKLHDQVIVIHPIERVCLEEFLIESGFKRESSKFLLPPSAFDRINSLKVDPRHAS